MTSQAWPELLVDSWQPTRDTLTLWLQVVGKFRIARTPLLNHWWNAPLYVTARGLTTSLISAGGGRASPSTSTCSTTTSRAPPHVESPAACDSNR